MKGMGDVNNLSSDRPKLTSVAGSSSSLDRHRSWERIVKAAKEYQRPQEGESSKSFSNDDFTRDNQKMKSLGKQVISHVEQMSTLIREQYNLMHSLSENFFRLQEGAGKRKSKSSRTTWMSLCAQLPKSPVWENQPGRSLQDFCHQTQVGLGQSRKTVEELME